MVTKAINGVVTPLKEIPVADTGISVYMETSEDLQTVLTEGLADSIATSEAEIEEADNSKFRGKMDSFGGD